VHNDASEYKIKISGLRVFAHHGVFDFERQNGQDFFIDAVVWMNGNKAALTDDLSDTVHYGTLAQAIVENVRNEPVDLIETLAQRLLDLVLNFGGPSSPIRKAKITVHKPSAPIPYDFNDVSITVKAKKKNNG
jgi:dihydroneopterin aldolase